MAVLDGLYIRAVMFSPEMNAITFQAKYVTEAGSRLNTRFVAFWKD